MPNKPYKPIHAKSLWVFPTGNGDLPRESELGRLLFQRYLEILRMPMEASGPHLMQLRRLTAGIRFVGSKRKRHLRLRKKDRKVMRSLLNWAENDPSDDEQTISSWETTPSQEGVAKGNSRRKTWELAYNTLVTTSTDSNTKIPYVVPSGTAPSYQTVRIQNALDYEVGPDRPFRPMTGSGGNARQPENMGVLPQYVIGYGPLKSFPAAYRWADLPQPTIHSEKPRYCWLGFPKQTENYAPSTRDVELARAEALASMYAGTPRTRTNWLRALIELKDTKSTARGLCDLYKFGRRFTRTMVSRPMWERLGNGPWRKVVVGTKASLAQVSSAYLNARFGIEPTVSDVGTFLDELRSISVLGYNRLKRGASHFFGEDRGRTFQDGAVVTSHYTVVPREYHELKRKTSVCGEGTGSFQVAWYNSDWAKRPQTGTVSMLPSRLKNDKALYRPKRFTAYSGTVFARMKMSDEVSTYLRERFGHVGYTWSYPGITTAWEILPFSWLVDWFANVRKEVRVAERLARSYWMRVAFQEPWYFEKSEFRYLYPWVKAEVCAPRGPDRARFYGGGSPMRATVTYTYRAMLSHRREARSNCVFARGPLSTRPEVPPSRRRVRFKVFQISIGMALIAQSATKRKA